MGRVAPGRCCSLAWPCLSGQAPLHSIHPEVTASSPRGLPQTCLPFPLCCFWQLKAGALFAKGEPQGFLRPSTLTPTGRGAECGRCSQHLPHQRSREGWGAQGCRHDRSSRTRSEAGLGEGQGHSISEAPHSWRQGRDRKGLVSPP